MIKSLFDHDEEEKRKPQPPQTPPLMENKPEDPAENESEEAIRRQFDELNLSPPAETSVASLTQTPPMAEDDDETQTITQIRQTAPETSFAEAIEDAEDDEFETIIQSRIQQIQGGSGADETATTADDIFPEDQFSELEAEIERQSLEVSSTTTENEHQPQFPASVTQYRNVLQNENAFQNQTAPAGEGVSSVTGNVSPREGQSLTTAETIRQSGMAWSAAVGLFGSVLFMMILGWFLDLLTGASPLFLVGGIIVGAGIGFYQFFRITSQIFKKD